jgi:nucleotide-binding universal stress UspA family protein
MAIVAVLYNFGFFTILAYTPFPLGLSAHQLGIVYFGWGLLVALTSVFAAQRLERRFGLVPVLGVALAGVAADLLAGALLIHSVAGLIVVVVISGGLLGIVNTVLTQAVMAAAVVERPVASSAYSFVRFTGGAIAPFVAGKLGEHVSAGAPMYLGAGMVAFAVVALRLSRHHLRQADAEPELPAPTAVPQGAVLVALDGSPASRTVIEAAERVARSRQLPVHVVHVRETRTVGADAADLEDRGHARALVDTAVAKLRRDGIAGATGEVLHVTGHHEDSARALLALADRQAPAAIVLGRATRGPASLTTIVSAEAPCDVVVVATDVHRPQPVAA